VQGGLEDCGEDLVAGVDEAFADVEGDEVLDGAEFVEVGAVGEFDEDLAFALGFDDFLADVDRSAQCIKVKLEVVWVGEEFHPGVGVSGWFGEGDGGELVFGADCFDLGGGLVELGGDCGRNGVAGTGGLKQLLVDVGLLFEDVFEF
jgi:hypothetical protein